MLKRKLKEQEEDFQKQLLAARLERDSIQDKIDLAQNVKVPNDVKD